MAFQKISFFGTHFFETGRGGWLLWAKYSMWKRYLRKTYLRSAKCRSVLRETPTRKSSKWWMRAGSCPWALQILLPRRWRTGRWRTARHIIHTGSSRLRALRRKSMMLSYPIQMRWARCWPSFRVRSWLRASRTHPPSLRAVCGQPLRRGAIPHGISLLPHFWRSPAVGRFCAFRRRSAHTQEKRWIKKRRFCGQWKRWASRRCVSCGCSAIQGQPGWPLPSAPSRNIFW